MSARNERDVARENGWTRLGRSEAEVEVQLLPEEKIALGISQSQSIQEIKKLESQFNDIKKDFKTKISNHEVIIDQSSEILRRGVKIIHKTLPCFLSADKTEKHWVDLETGEVVMSRPANQNDIQQSIFNENFID